MAIKTVQQVAVSGIFEVEIIGLEAVMTGLNAYDQIATEELSNAMNESVKAIAAYSRQIAPRWRGNLAGSMTSRVMPSSSYILGEVYSTAQPAVYPMAMEYGRRAGKMPPVDAIRPWAEAHGLNAWAVALTLKKRPIKPHRFLKKSFDMTRAAVVGVFGMAVERIAQRMGAK
jgi:hypothetical protein